VDDTGRAVAMGRSTRPLASVALAYASGLVLGNWLQPTCWSLLSISLGLTLIALIWSAGRRWLLWPLVVLTGWANLVSRTAVLSPSDLRETQGNAAQIVTIRGLLAETPDQRIYIRDEQEISRSLAQVRIEKIRGANGAWQ